MAEYHFRRSLQARAGALFRQCTKDQDFNEFCRRPRGIAPSGLCPWPCWHWQVCSLIPCLHWSVPVACWHSPRTSAQCLLTMRMQQAPRRTALLATQNAPVLRHWPGACDGPPRAGLQPGAHQAKEDGAAAAAKQQRPHRFGHAEVYARARRSTSAAACCAATWAWRWPRWARRARRWAAWARPSRPTRPTRWPSLSARACCSAWSASRTRWQSWRRCGCALCLPCIYPMHAIHLPYVYPIPARRGLAA